VAHVPSDRSAADRLYRAEVECNELPDPQRGPARGHVPIDDVLRDVPIVTAGRDTGDCQLATRSDALGAGLGPLDSRVAAGCESDRQGPNAEHDQRSDAA